MTVNNMWIRITCVMKTLGKILLDFFELTLVGVAIFIMVYLFAGQLLEVTGNSMYPNFLDKEQIVLEKLSIKLKNPQRGEVIVFRHPDEPEKLLIKRVIGLPNETIKIFEGSVYINGSKLEETYLEDGVVTKGKTIIKEDVEYVVKPNAYVVMGDNREQSNDSRDWGEIYLDEIVGRGMLVYYPTKNFRIIW